MNACFQLPGALATLFQSDLTGAGQWLWKLNTCGQSCRSSMPTQPTLSKNPGHRGSDGWQHLCVLSHVIAGRSQLCKFPLGGDNGNHTAGPSRTPLDAPFPLLIFKLYSFAVTVTTSRTAFLSCISLLANQKLKGGPGDPQCPIYKENLFPTNKMSRVPKT